MNLTSIVIIEHHQDVVNLVQLVKLADGCPIALAASKDGTVSVWSVTERLPSFYNKFDSIY